MTTTAIAMLAAHAAYQENASADNYAAWIAARDAYAADRLNW